MCNNKHYFRCCLVLGFVCIFVHNSHSQVAADTAGWIRQFREMLAFDKQPSIFIETRIRLESSPVLEARDTLSRAGAFYKDGTSFYSSDSDEEYFIDDSLVVEINHQRQTVTVNRISAEARERAIQSTMEASELFARLGRQYEVSRSSDKYGLAHIHAVPRIPFANEAIYRIDLAFDPATLVPRQLKINAELKLPATTEYIEAYQKEGYDVQPLVKLENGHPVILRRQSMFMDFVKLSTQRPANFTMPVWSRYLSFDPATNQFTAKEELKEYSIVQTF